MKKIFIAFSAIAMMVSCADDPIGQTAVEHGAPSPIDASTVKVENVPGGANLIYKLPGDEDILYVEARYTTNRGAEKTRASVYQDTLKIRGFGDTEPRDVRLVVVDRNTNVSSPITVQVHPEIPPLYAIAESMNLEQAFGGVKLTWENPTAADVVITLWKKDKVVEDDVEGGTTDDDKSKVDADGNPIFYQVESLYTNRTVGENSFRGMKAEEADFAVVVSDRWENKTVREDHVWTLTPLFEMQIPPTFMKGIKAIGDTDFAWGWRHENICDGNTGSGWHTETFSGPWPHRATITFNKPVKMSRIKIYHRFDGFLYKHGNPRQIELYGYQGEEIPDDESLDQWELIRECNSLKPSGLTGIGEYTGEDEAYMKDGEEFDIPIEAPEYRHIKVVVTKNWAGSDNFTHIMEVKVYGKVEGVNDPSEIE